MKTSGILWMGVASLLTACGNSNGDYDASGIFETTEVIVSAKSNGEIMRFDVEEGQEVSPQLPVGHYTIASEEGAAGCYPGSYR